MIAGLRNAAPVQVLTGRARRRAASWRSQSMSDSFVPHGVLRVSGSMTLSRANAALRRRWNRFSFRTFAHVRGGRLQKEDGIGAQVLHSATEKKLEGGNRPKKTACTRALFRRLGQMGRRIEDTCNHSAEFEKYGLRKPGKQEEARMRISWFHAFLMVCISAFARYFHMVTNS